MAANNSIFRERFRNTLAHQPVDRCPVDFAGTPFTNILHPGLLRAIAEHLHPETSSGKSDTELVEMLQVYWNTDFRRVGGLIPFNNPRRHRISETETMDEYGIRFRLMGTYWEICGYPLADATLDDLAAYELPKLEEMPTHLLDEWEARARYLWSETTYVVVGEHPVFGVLELACWLCGYDTVMLKMHLEPEFISVLFDKILAFQKEISAPYYDRLGRYLHLTTSGDDFGTQSGMFMSLDCWREYVKPRMKDRMLFTRTRTDAAWLHHSCGAVSDLIPDLIDTGVDILNPVQTAACGMDPVLLKEQYGNKIVFHGGLDTQKVLPSGDKNIINEAVGELMNSMRPCLDGGYIFGPSHNLQDDVSVEAVAAMYGAASGIH
jgi:uroporphyrinogen decarboxylase